MAKQIKAIKCPQCGSSSHTKLTEDHYKCNSCGTEYFLDNDDININVNHKGNSVDSSRIIKIIVAGSVILTLMIVFINACGALFRSTPKTPTYNAYSSSSRENKEEEKEKSEDSFKSSFVFEYGDKNTVIFSIVERRYKNSPSKDQKDGYYFIFTDLLSNKVIKEIKLDIKSLSDNKLRTLFNGKTYLTINKRTLYEINRKDLSVDDVTETMFKSRQEFTSGIASVEFVYEPYGSGLHVMTNLGKEYFYYPIVDKVYTEKTYYNARSGFKSLLPVTKDVTYYEFSSKSDDFKDEPIQLLKIVYKSNCGGPEGKETNPSWFKDYVRYGIIDDDTPYKKQLFRYDLSRVISYKDLTPGRWYFKSDVKYYDDKVIIIKYRPTVAEDAAIILQCLDANTYDVKWTLNLDKETDFRDDLIKTAQGYVSQMSYDHFFIIGEDGKIDKDIKLEKERIVK